MYDVAMTKLREFNLSRFHFSTLLQERYQIPRLKTIFAFIQLIIQLIRIQLNFKMDGLLLKYDDNDFAFFMGNTFSFQPSTFSKSYFPIVEFFFKFYVFVIFSEIIMNNGYCFRKLHSRHKLFWKFILMF